MASRGQETPIILILSNVSRSQFLLILRSSTEQRICEIPGQITQSRNSADAEKVPDKSYSDMYLILFMVSILALATSVPDFKTRL